MDLDLEGVWSIASSPSCTRLSASRRGRTTRRGATLYSDRLRLARRAACEIALYSLSFSNSVSSLLTA